MLGAGCLLAILSIGIPAYAQGVSWLPSASSSKQEASADAAQGVQKDDSQLTVVNASPDDNASIVDTAAKKKKKSFWDNKVFHPTQWFSKKK
jgi:hypothetical protein